MTTQTLEQRRAGDALAQVAALNRESPAFKERYRAYVDRLCASIVMTGLGQALATERAAAGPKPTKDGERAHAALYEHVQQWLCRRDGVYAQAADLLQAITTSDEALYLHAEAEALAWLQWHKKFCRAAFPKGAEE
ncbi:MAG: type III-B CRISPR module-associated protein Cmr5 [Planctomycetes bacterium]|nr:type III-B CRISPR module-associated protein Cmr5 [Planctomycetota bacterium]